MLRSVAAAAAAALLVAGCGDDDTPAASAPPGISGTLFGQPFTPADSSALVLSSSTCSFSGISANATGLLIGFGSFQGLCSFVTQNATCGNKANATIATLLVVRANVLPGATAAPVQPGTYTISAATPTPDAQGNVTVPAALVVKNDAACNNPSGTPEATSGTIRIDSIGARITGSADLTFEGGGRLAGAFDVPVCGFQTDVCTVLADGRCTTSACVP
jgi:hypothetical protein